VGNFDEQPWGISASGVNGQMAVRWCAAGMLEAAKQFRRVKGHLHLRALRVELDKRAGVTTPEYQQDKDVA